MNQISEVSLDSQGARKRVQSSSKNIDGAMVGIDSEIARETKELMKAGVDEKRRAGSALLDDDSFETDSEVSSVSIASETDLDTQTKTLPMPGMSERVVGINDIVGTWRSDSSKVFGFRSKTLKALDQAISAHEAAFDDPVGKLNDRLSESGFSDLGDRVPVDPLHHKVSDELKSLQHLQTIIHAQKEANPKERRDAVKSLEERIDLRVKSLSALNTLEKAYIAYNRAARNENKLQGLQSLISLKQSMKMSLSHLTGEFQKEGDALVQAINDRVNMLYQEVDITPEIIIQDVKENNGDMVVDMCLTQPKILFKSVTELRGVDYSALSKEEYDRLEALEEEVVPKAGIVTRFLMAEKEQGRLQSMDSVSFLKILKPYDMSYPGSVEGVVLQEPALQEIYDSSIEAHRQFGEVVAKYDKVLDGESLEHLTLVSTRLLYDHYEAKFNSDIVRNFRKLSRQFSSFELLAKGSINQMLRNSELHRAFFKDEISRFNQAHATDYSVEEALTTEGVVEAMVDTLCRERPESAVSCLEGPFIGKYMAMSQIMDEGTEMLKEILTVSEKYRYALSESGFDLSKSEIEKTTKPINSTLIALMKQLAEEPLAKRQALLEKYLTETWGDWQLDAVCKPVLKRVILQSLPSSYHQEDRAETTSKELASAIQGSKDLAQTALDFHRFSPRTELKHNGELVCPKGTSPDTLIVEMARVFDGDAAASKISEVKAQFMTETVNKPMLFRKCFTEGRLAQFLPSFNQTVTALPNELMTRKIIESGLPIQENRTKREVVVNVEEEKATVSYQLHFTCIDFSENSRSEETGSDFVANINIRTFFSDEKQPEIDVFGEQFEWAKLLQKINAFKSGSNLNAKSVYESVNLEVLKKACLDIGYIGSVA